MTWNRAAVWQILPTLHRGLAITVEATLPATARAVVLRLVLALLRRSPVKAASTPAAAFVELVHSMPRLVPLYVLFYALRLRGITFSALSTGIAALGLHDATCTSEACRGNQKRSTRAVGGG
jgi:polar amino acid transport system permease protein